MCLFCKHDSVVYPGYSRIVTSRRILRVLEFRSDPSPGLRQKDDASTRDQMWRVYNKRKRDGGAFPSISHISFSLMRSFVNNNTKYSSRWRSTADFYIRSCPGRSELGLRQKTEISFICHDCFSDKPGFLPIHRNGFYQKPDKTFVSTLTFYLCRE